MLIHDIVDIETGAEDRDTVLRFTKPYPEFVQPGPFDPASVKFGNRKTDEARASYLEECRLKYEESSKNARAEWEAGKREHEEKAMRDAATNPLTGRILAIGILYFDGREEILTAENAEQEKAMLSRFLRIVAERRAAGRKMGGYCIYKFDIGFVMRRALKYGLDVSILRGNRPNTWSDQFVDIVDYWFGGERGPNYLALDDLLAFLGLPPKAGCGADFEKKFFANREDAIHYLHIDLVRERQVAERLGLLRAEEGAGGVDIAA